MCMHASVCVARCCSAGLLVLLMLCCIMCVCHVCEYGVLLCVFAVVVVFVL